MEVLVAMTIVFVLLAITTSIVVTSNGAVQASSEQTTLNEEARRALNRMARDSRQATEIVTAVNPDGSSFSTSALVGVRFRADFDGDDCVGGVALPGRTLTTPCNSYNSGNPEDISYCFEPASRQLFVIDNQAASVTPLSATTSSCTGGQPLLAGNVQALLVEYRSNAYRYDTSPTDGVTTWSELDQAGPPVGDNDGKLAYELSNIDSLVFTITMRIGNRNQIYRTQVDLRNKS